MNKPKHDSLPPC